MKYNTKTTGRGPAQKTVNAEGGEAFTLDNRTALYMRASTSLGGGSADKFYTTAKEDYNAIVDLVTKVAKTDPEFIFQLAAYCREDLHLRSIPTVLFIEGIRALKASKTAGAPYPVDASQYASYIFGRADEIVEAMAYWLAVENNNVNLPAPFRKSLQLALNKFDEYRLLKYNQTDKAVTFKDIVRLTHPQPKNDTQKAIFRYFIKDEIDPKLMPKTIARQALLRHDKFDATAQELIKASHATWETVTSKFGSSKEVWESVIPNMGYMALLRNLNNFIKTDVNLDPVIARLTDRNEVLKSKQLPFRFYSAMKALLKDTTEVSNRYSYMDNVNTAFDKWNSKVNNTDKVQRLVNALGIALNLSIANIPNMEGRTLVAADLSGSMGSLLNDKSSISCREIAALMAGCATEVARDNIAAGFGETFAVAKGGTNALETAKNIDALQVGHSTNAYLILEYLYKNRIFVDRVMYFTDTHCYNDGTYGYGDSLNTLWDQYKALVVATGRPAPFLYEVNLVGGNTSNFLPQKNVALIGGWSERIFELMGTYERDPRSAVQKIKEKYSLSVAV